MATLRDSIYKLTQLYWQCRQFNHRQIYEPIMNLIYIDTFILTFSQIDVVVDHPN